MDTDGWSRPNASPFPLTESVTRISMTSETYNQFFAYIVFKIRRISSALFHNVSQVTVSWNGHKMNCSITLTHVGHQVRYQKTPKRPRDELCQLIILLILSTVVQLCEKSHFATCEWPSKSLKVVDNGATYFFVWAFCSNIVSILHHLRDITTFAVNVTKVMASDGIACRIGLLIHNEQLEQMDTFPYFGSLMTEDGECTTEFRTRLNRGQAIGTSLQKIWKHHSIPISTKIDTTNESASLACSNVRLWKLVTRKKMKKHFLTPLRWKAENDSAGFVNSKEN